MRKIVLITFLLWSAHGYADCANNFYDCPGNAGWSASDSDDTYQNPNDPDNVYTVPGDPATNDSLIPPPGSEYDSYGSEDPYDDDAEMEVQDGSLNCMDTNDC